MDKRVCYYYDPRISYVDYGDDHCMVPHRVTMAHALIKAYGLTNYMDLLRVSPATAEDLVVAHDEEYLALLRELTPDGDVELKRRAKKHKIGPINHPGCSTVTDNPVIEDLWDYCQRYAGGSLAAARALASGRYDIAINWSGGMHHASRDSASGFCYVNDIVVAIRALLDGGRFGRVLYVDVDAHHGDGVEAAFLEESRVMTVSFHQYRGRDSFFFPGTGAVDDVGAGAGLYRTLNVPLEAGTGDARYRMLFEPIVARVMEVFRPDAVVLQCGADSLAGDRIAGLGLSVRGHANCVRVLRGYGLPLLLLGGGGYTINHVAACWCYETAVAIGKDDIPDAIPQHGYQHYYRSQGYKLHYDIATSSNGINGSTETKHMKTVKQRVMQHLDQLSALLTTTSPKNAEEQDDNEDEPPPRKAEDINVDALLDDAPRPPEDPVERLHRRCGEVDLTRFLVWLGRKEVDKRRKMADLEQKR